MRWTTTRLTLSAVAVATVCASVGAVGEGHAAPHDGASSVLADEFDGPAGAAPSSIWIYDVGGGGWGNGEQQVYTGDRANSRLDGNGRLVIEARRTGGTITSARLTTRGRFSFTHGLLEARIATPRGTGLHPAFWLLGTDIGSVGYPGSG